MRKLFSTRVGVLVILSLCFSLNAKSISFSSSRVLYNTSDLSEKLAADKDFQELSISVYSFITKVQETKSGVLFQKLILKTASTEELFQLAQKLSYPSVEKLNSFSVGLSLLQVKIQQKFPEIIGNTSIKPIIEKAALGVVLLTKKPSHNTGDCWLAWMTGLAACTQACSLAYSGDEYNTCFWSCSSAWSGVAGWCFITAD